VRFCADAGVYAGRERVRRSNVNGEEQKLSRGFCIFDDVGRGDFLMRLADKESACIMYISICALPHRVHQKVAYFSAGGANL